jgi:hypothetical protein
LAATTSVPFVSPGGPADGALDLEAELAERDGELAPAPTHRDDMAFWLYSPRHPTPGE